MRRNYNRAGKMITSYFFGIVLILIGLFFLFKDYLSIDFSVAMLWPLFMLIPIIPILSELVSNFKKNSGAVIPLTILTFLMCYFLWLNYYGWENSQYTWPNYILAPGLGLLFYSIFSKEKSVIIPAFILIGISAIFYATISNSVVFAAAIFIILGGILLLQSLFKIRFDSNDDDDENSDDSDKKDI